MSHRPEGIVEGNAPGQRGFVLVGVVTLVLALTILGLSLFSLSSYESQFLNRSIDEMQAFHCAQGGLERAMYALAVPPYRLEDVGQNLPLEHVTAAEARQLQGSDTVSVGPVVWDGEDVVIRVTAEYRGETRTVEGRYRPQKLENYYKRLVTSAGGIEVNPTFNDGKVAQDRSQTVSLWGGGFWQNDADTSWTSVTSSYAPHGIRIGSAAVPDVASFIAAHWAQARLPDDFEIESERHLHLESPSDDEVGYFRWEDSGGTWGFEDQRRITIHVQGRVVWMFDRGFRFWNDVTVRREGQGDAALVMVARPNLRDQDHPEAGVWFWGGLASSDSVHVVLVSDGSVRCEQINNPQRSLEAKSVSIFAGRAIFTGPEPGKFMSIARPAAADTAIDWLAAHAALPNTHGAAAAQFALVPGTWREASP
jgi:hypothetical protein